MCIVQWNPGKNIPMYNVHIFNQIASRELKNRNSRSNSKYTGIALSGIPITNVKWKLATYLKSMFFYFEGFTSIPTALTANDKNRRIQVYQASDS